jgi:hypothetical protein
LTRSRTICRHLSSSASISGSAGAGLPSSIAITKRVTARSRKPTEGLGTAAPARAGNKE